ncbi:aminotransferase class V-fold PLP-dependent enzyme [Alkalilimnicola sp. S0819]|uniref:aminotransferase class V-fold PLP-dependent enzyme n=1 Tax=Alkalilimnicola sp. S0819 TaxID=2613922 RepID=UPI0012618F4A|nr:cysteine desulfurase [Alkalilimnicola sp. S0819]KAB7623632.1 cysteine desulfurase [Alkalilimnicola sp. S0819]MPQ16756.1 SufS family cysteine desulfurase [Alkalilimnicola sp. S0819]
MSNLKAQLGLPGRLDVARLREDFPILSQTVHGRPLVYLDNGASAQKPEAVIEAERRCYREYYANIHRGVHYLSQTSTTEYEAARGKVQRFLNAASDKEIVFTRGTTESINLVAHSYVRPRLRAGDEILVSAMEHHSNIVPWQLLCEETGAVLKVIPISEAGEIDLDAFAELLGERTRLLSVVHVSNALGTVNPVAEMIRQAHAKGIPVLLDGAQAVPHMPVDVQALGADFYAFSAHKLYGPTGVGVLYGKYDLLKAMRPYQGGGDMIKTVSFEKTIYADPPNRFEAGTPNIAGVIALGAAVDYLSEVGLEAIAAYEQELLDYATERLSAIPGLRIIGTAPNKAGVISFVMDGAHPHDIGTLLDEQGVAVRAGHHCAEPVMRRYAVPATARASFGLYNTREEVDVLVAAIEKVRELFGA